VAGDDRVKIFCLECGHFWFVGGKKANTELNTGLALLMILIAILFIIWSVEGGPWGRQYRGHGFRYHQYGLQRQTDLPGYRYWPQMAATVTAARQQGGRRALEYGCL